MTQRSRMFFTAFHSSIVRDTCIARFHTFADTPAPFSAKGCSGVSLLLIQLIQQKQDLRSSQSNSGHFPYVFQMTVAGSISRGTHGDALPIAGSISP
jgi:hypothetical protein